MKTNFKYALVVLAVSALLAPSVLAKQGTGGSNTPDVPDTTTPVVEDTTIIEAPAADPTPEPVVTAPEVETTTDTSVTLPDTSTNTPVNTNTTINAEAITTTTAEKMCYELEDLKERINCRLNKTEEELEEEPYSPEGCRTRSEAWQEKCKELYTKIYPCYEKPVGDNRISCLKDEIGLPNKLKKLSDECETQDPECIEAYTKQIVNLVGARFYDAEERVEDWFADGEIDQETTVDFLVFITEAKWDLYNAESNSERMEVVERVDEEWEKLVSSL